MGHHCEADIIKQRVRSESGARSSWKYILRWSPRLSPEMTVWAENLQRWLAHFCRGIHSTKALQAVHGLWKMSGYSNKVLDIVLASVAEPWLWSLSRCSGGWVGRKLGGQKRGKWRLSSCIPLNTVASLEWFSELCRGCQPLVMVFFYKRKGEKGRDGGLLLRVDICLNSSNSFSIPVTHWFSNWYTLSVYSSSV